MAPTTTGVPDMATINSATLPCTIETSQIAAKEANSPMVTNRLLMKPCCSASCTRGTINVEMLPATQTINAAIAGPASACALEEWTLKTRVQFTVGYATRKNSSTSPAAIND